MRAVALGLRMLHPFGVDLFCTGKKFLTYNLLGRNLKVKYRRSVVGVLWTLLTPLAMAAIYYFVFKVVMGVKQEHYHIFILVGVLAWALFSQTVIEGLDSIVANWGLLSKVPMPIQVFSLSGSLTNLITFLLSLPILYGVGLASGTMPTPGWLLIPIYALMLAVMSFSISMVLGILYVYLRDLKHIINLIFQIWLYATPVVYNESMIPEKYRFMLLLNPVGTIFVGLHRAMLSPQWVVGSEFLVGLVWTVVSVLLAALMIRKFGPNVVEKL